MEKKETRDDDDEEETETVESLDRVARERRARAQPKKGERDRVGKTKKKKIREKKNEITEKGIPSVCRRPWRWRGRSAVGRSEKGRNETYIVTSLSESGYAIQVALAGRNSILVFNKRRFFVYEN